MPDCRQSVIIRMTGFRNMVTYPNSWQITGSSNLKTALTLLRWFNRVDWRDWFGSGRYLTVVLRDSLKSILSLKIAYYDYGRVIGPIKSVVKLPEAFHRHSFNVRTPSDRRMVVWMFAKRHRV